MKRLKAYCYFCFSPLNIYRQRHVGLRHIFFSLLSAFCVGYLLFLKVDFRSLTLAGFFLVLAEYFIHLRWRLSHICRECGFDPFLYKNNPEQAAAQVKEKLKQRQSDPLAYLKPPLKIPIKVVTPQKNVKILRNGDQALTPYLIAQLYQEKKYHTHQQGNRQPQNTDTMTPAQLSQ